MSSTSTTTPPPYTTWKRKERCEKAKADYEFCVRSRQSVNKCFYEFELVELYCTNKRLAPMLFKNMLHTSKDPSADT